MIRAANLSTARPITEVAPTARTAKIQVDFILADREVRCGQTLPDIAGDVRLNTSRTVILSSSFGPLSRGDRLIEIETNLPVGERSRIDWAKGLGSSRSRGQDG